MATSSVKKAVERNSGLLSMELRVPFPSQQLAIVAYGSLFPDPEPRKEIVKKLRVEDKELVVLFTAPQARLLRVAFHSFLDHLDMTIQTMEKFGPADPQDV
ncbi:EKC/KEOPS complex subunit LAGE3-like [Branchiostoma lanceolatum]|uniref:EKC/KEOPS complex subunit LAGE3-like n=1 Tax=Branchiostoma lanceolatum TaxID=7740 RepID=UPI003454D68D